MSGAVADLSRVQCRDCQFEYDIDGTEDVLPAEVVIKHGRETGHKLRVVRPEP